MSTIIHRRLARANDSALGRASDGALRRLSSEAVSYMEVTANAGAFSCGACRHFILGHCASPKVLAPVSATHGCCNLYWPRHGKPVFDAATVRASLRSKPL